MIRMRRRSPRRESRPPELIRRKRRIRRARNLLFLIIFLGMFGLGFNRVIAYEDSIKRSTFTIQGVIPVPVIEMRPSSGETALVAIVAHGFAGSKDLMTGFGDELARAGITTYLFDFPGHGESPVPLADNTFSGRAAQDNITTVGEVVTYARTHNSVTPHPNIILLGHSMGSAAVGDYSMAHPDGDIVSTILVSPVGQEQPTLTQPKNLLMLAGQNDIPFTIVNSTHMLQLGCGLSQPPALPAGCGNPNDGTGRLAVVLTGLNHITILNAGSTYDEVLNWLNRAYPNLVNIGHMQSNIRLFWLLLGIAGIILAVFPLSSLALDMFDIYGVVRPFRGQDVVFFDLCAIVGIAVAIADPIFLATLWLHSRAACGLCQRLLFHYSSCACAVSLHCARYGASTCISPDNKTNYSGYSALALPVYYTWPACDVCLAAFDIHSTAPVAFCSRFSNHLAALPVG